MPMATKKAIATAGRLMASLPKRARARVGIGLVMATRVVGNEEGNGKSGKSNGDGNKKGNVKGDKIDAYHDKEGNGNGDKMLMLMLYSIIA
jgi:hypothetical protein